ncbi:MAG: hypothetical protein AB8B74_05070 [Crocinitomicaceae bacterium]
MKRLNSTLIVSLLVVCPQLIFGQTDTTTHDKEYYSYHDEVKENFKNESIWYRIWNRYDVNPGFSKYAVGTMWSTPLNGWQSTSRHLGFRYHQNHVELSGGVWQGVRKNESDTLSAYRLSLGYFTPLSFFSIGKRYLDVKGFLIQPAMGFGYTLTNGNHGAYFGCGLQVQLPFVIAEARANMQYTFGGGFNVFPEISLQFDALRTLLDPQTVKTGKFDSQFTSASPIGGGWYKVTTKYYSNDFNIEDIGPLWGVTPRVGRAFRAWSDNPYNTFGIGISGRLNFLGADIHMDRGMLQTGVVSNVQALDGIVKNKFDNDQVLGWVNTTEITFEANLNIVGLCLGIFKKKAIVDMGWKTTPLNRFNFHLGFTRINPGKVEYINEDQAKAYTDEFFTTHPTIERNAINDPLQHEKEWAVTYGISYEMGAVGIRVNNKLSKSSGRGATLELYYILPITKIIKAYQ